MKKKFLDILCCPVCKCELKLKISKEENEEIIEGELLCRKCDKVYPIKDGIPDLLPRE
jgi:uncharacterized protein YbaR (Trm112 family)